MATIKDVARLAGVSPTTVSIVLNRQDKERNISEATKLRILNSIEMLNYRPNTNARRLRSSDGSKPIIVLFWPIDYLIHIMSVVINDLLTRIHSRALPCELVIQTYEPDNYSQISGFIRQNEYDAAIIGCASQKIIDDIDALETKCPIVFLNRESRSHAYVTTDFEKAMQETAQIFARKGYQNIGVLTSSQSNAASERRLHLFIQACSELGIAVPEKYTVYAESTSKSGFNAMERYLSLDSYPKAVFSNSDIIALGALAACNRKGVKIPEDIEILAMELMDPQFNEFSIPALTTIAIPTNEICGHIIDYIIKKLNNSFHLPERIQCDAKLTVRESFII